MLANRGLPEVEARQSGAGGPVTLLLTLLRCVGWLSRDDLSVRRGHAGPGLPTPGAQCLGGTPSTTASSPTMATGWRRCRWRAPSPRRCGRSPAASDPGPLPPRHSFVTVEPREVSISALKTAEDGNGLVLRLWNAAARAGRRPVRAGAARAARALAANLKEEPGRGHPTSRADGSLTVPCAPGRPRRILLRSDGQRRRDSYHGDDRALQACTMRSPRRRRTRETLHSLSD